MTIYQKVTKRTIFELYRELDGIKVIPSIRFEINWYEYMPILYISIEWICWGVGFAWTRKDD